MTDARPDGRLFVGMISGTSRDGVDVALVDLGGPQPRLLSTLCLPYPEDVANELAGMIGRAVRPDPETMQALDSRLAEIFADAANRVIAASGTDATQVEAIGSHGQTVWHDPDAKSPESIQLGHPAKIARITGIRTVGNFRQADMQAGGQGAPLAPLLHRKLFLPDSGCRAVLNLGGIANVSLLYADGKVSGFDTGPANCLLDGWISRCQGRPYDENGRWAAGGRVIADLLQAMLRDDYFARAAPKSTGVEYFNAGWLAPFLNEAGKQRSLSDRDVQATLSELTARTVADALAPFRPGEIVVCGGGSHNTDLLGRIARLSSCTVLTTAELGLHPDWVEAVLFAWLAQECLDGEAQDTRAITGARCPVPLGEAFSPRR